LNYDSLHYIDVLLEVIASEFVAHLIASDLGIQYDEAMNVFIYLIHETMPFIPKGYAA
jgi:hypothetical protein